MKIVRVEYTTTAAYAAINQENIRGIVRELATLNHPGIRYEAYVLPDGKTFMHFDRLADEATHDILTSLASFKKFADELHASGLEVEPKLEIMQLVAGNES